MKTATTLLLILGGPLALCEAQTPRDSSSPRRASKRKSAKDDQISIVGGKALSFAVGKADEVAMTPPGKWANAYGFTHYRYAERGTGRNKVSLNGLVGRAADGVATVLTPDQLAILVDIVDDQHVIESRAIGNRNRISRELFRWRTGTPGDEERILAMASENGELLFELLTQRSLAYGRVFASLTPHQSNDLRRVRKGTYEGVRPKTTAALRARDGSRIDKQQTTLVLAKFLTWSTGTEAMNQFIDPGRPAVFFGFASLRISNRSGDNGSKSLRRDASSTLYAVLDEAQLGAMKRLVTDQAEFLATYVDTRGRIGSIVTTYRSAKVAADTESLRRLCIDSEVAEARLGLLQAERLSELIAGLSDGQMATLREFAARSR